MAFCAHLQRKEYLKILSKYAKYVLKYVQYMYIDFTFKTYILT